MTIIAVVSAAGGAGRTTLTATLAALLCARGHAVLALDLDPRNHLALHLGLPLSETDGLAPRLLAAGDWRQGAFQNSEGVRVLPFGKVDSGRLAQVEPLLDPAGGWLRAQLSQLALGEQSFVLIDTPRLPSRSAHLAIAASDLVLGVLAADAAAMQDAQTIERSCTGRPLWYAINQLDAARPLQRDVMAMLRAQMGERLAPYPIHRDHALPEAVASNRSLGAHAPHAQAAHDFQGLANWLMQRPGAAAA